MGSSQMFRFTGNKEWSRGMRAAVCLFWGRWGLPLPYKHDIISLVGEPVTGVYSALGIVLSSVSVA